MLVFVLGMLVCVGLAVAVLWVVAVPARRDGRDVLTPKGEEVVSQVSEKTGSLVDGVRVRIGEALDTTREKVAYLTRQEG